MSDGKIIHLSGGGQVVNEPNEHAIELLRELLERAEAGEIIGVGAVALHENGQASYYFRGRIGGYGMVGAAAILRDRLADVADGTDA